MESWIGQLELSFELDRNKKNLFWFWMQSMIEGKEKENKSPSQFDFEGIEIYIRLEDRPSSISVKGFGSTSNFRRPAKKLRIKDEYSGISIRQTPLGPEKKCPLYGDVRFIEIPYKTEYLAKINQEWVVEVNGFHSVKKGHVEWNEKYFYFKNDKSNATTSKQKSKVNNIDILVDWNQLKYDVIDFCQ